MEGLRALPHRLVEEVLLALDVGVERALLDADRVGEGADGRAVVALLGEEAGGLAGKLLAAAHGTLRILTIVRLGGDAVLERMTDEEFRAYVQEGGQVETGDPMPDDYRKALIKFIEMHGNSELMGVLPEREWILRAPTLQRKLALTAKVQDEVGHGQLIYRVVEDLGKPREACFERPDRRQDEVPQRLPLPDEDVGRRRRDRLARRRGGDHLPEGAAQVLVRALRADHEEDLLGGVVPHPPRPRRRARDDDRHRRAAGAACRRRSTAGGAR